MKLVASTLLIVVSTLLLGFYALVWLLSPTPPNPLGGDSREIFVTAIGVAGLLLGIMALVELRRQRKEVARLKQENEGFV